MGWKTTLIANGVKDHNHCQWGGRSHPLPMGWKITSIANGVEDHILCQWGGRSHPFPVGWKTTSIANGVEDHIHCQWGGRSHPLPMPYKRDRSKQSLLYLKTVYILGSSWYSSEVSWLTHRRLEDTSRTIYSEQRWCRGLWQHPL